MTMLLTDPESTDPERSGSSTSRVEIVGRSEDSCFYEVKLTSATDALVPFLNHEMSCTLPLYEDAPSGSACNSRFESIFNSMVYGSMQGSGPCTGQLSTDLQVLYNTLYP